MTSEGPARALVSLVRRNRRRYGGYIVHVGMAVLFVGVAASSAFQHARDVRLRAGPDGDASAATRSRYVKPTARVDDARRRRRAHRARRAASTCARTARKVAAPAHRARLLPVVGAVRPGGLVRGLFEGEATSEVGMKAGLLRDVWTAVQPDPEYLSKVIAGVRRPRRPTSRSPSRSGAVARAASARLRQRGVVPAQFRLIVSPLVAWIWIGGLIVFAGGLIALWPAPDAAPGPRRGPATPRAWRRTSAARSAAAAWTSWPR